MVSQSIVNCYNTGKIYIKKNVEEENSSTIPIGGIVGITANSISHCYNIAEIKIEGTGIFKIGGILGQFNQGTVYNCYNSGTLINNTNSYAGGIIGYFGYRATLSKTLQNNYFVNAEKGIGYIATDNSTYTTKLEQELSKEELLNILNAEVSKFKIIENEDYPVLAWEN